MDKIWVAYGVFVLLVVSSPFIILLFLRGRPTKERKHSNRSCSSSSTRWSEVGTEIDSILKNIGSNAE